MLPLLGHKKISAKALPLFGVLPLLIKKKKVYALIRSVAFIRVLLLLGGLPHFFSRLRREKQLQPTPPPFVSLFFAEKSKTSPGAGSSDREGG